MKIFKVQVVKTAYIIPDPNANPQQTSNTNITNEIETQQQLNEISDFAKLSDVAATINDALSQLEEIIGDTGLKQTVSDKINEIVINNPTIKLLMTKGKITGVQNLKEDIERATIETNRLISHMQQIQPQGQGQTQEGFEGLV